MKSHNLRNLLSVAGKLRHLADDSPDLDDQALYLTAAQALEAHARLLATSRPLERRREPSVKLRVYQPDNMPA